jgi:hypothetical protein
LWIAELDTLEKEYNKYKVKREKIQTADVSSKKVKATASSTKKIVQCKAK